MIKERKLTALHISVYLVIFFVLWSIRELYYTSCVSKSLKPNCF